MNQLALSLAADQCQHQRPNQLPKSQKTAWKHTGRFFLKKEVPVCFQGGQGSAGIRYHSIPSHFEPFMGSVCEQVESELMMCPVEHLRAPTLARPLPARSRGWCLLRSSGAPWWPSSARSSVRARRFRRRSRNSLDSKCRRSSTSSWTLGAAPWTSTPTIQRPHRRRRWVEVTANCPLWAVRPPDLPATRHNTDFSPAFITMVYIHIPHNTSLVCIHVWSIGCHRD